jgi:hypothetical protein
MLSCSNKHPARQKLIADFGATNETVSWAVPVEAEPKKKTKTKKPNSTKIK